MTERIPLVPSAMLGPRFTAAVDLAIRLHRDDVRKGKTIPYIAHLLGVCELVLQDGGSEDEAIAALLHDALEDHPEGITTDEMQREFGAGVLAIVRAARTRWNTTAAA